MKQWHERYPQCRDLEISVNLSVKQFRQPDLCRQLAAVLEETGLEPRLLQLEVTETVLLDEFDKAVETVKCLKALNAGLKIDDFGTGYSCLRYLSKLPFDTLKIDRSFTIDLSKGREADEVVRTIVNLAQTLGMDVVAEGIEEQEQALLLRTMGVSMARASISPSRWSRERRNGTWRRTASPASRVEGKTIMGPGATIGTCRARSPAPAPGAPSR